MAGTLVDSLVVQLSLDPAPFKQGAAESDAALKRIRTGAETTAKELESEGKRAAQFFSQVKTEALSLIGVLVGAGGLASFIKDTTQSLARLGDQAAHLGVAAPQLAAFANMIARQGGNAEVAAASFVALTDAMENYRLTGTSPMANFFNRIGVDRADNALTVLEKFQAFAEKNAGDVPLINFIGHGIGLDQGTIDATVRMKTLAKMHEELGRSYELGVPTPEMTDRARAFQGALVGLGEAAAHDGDILLNELYPGLTKAADGLAKFIEQNPKALAGLALLGGWLVTISALNFSALMALLARFAAIAPFFAAILEFSVGASSEATPTTPQELEKTQHDRWETAKKKWRENAPTWLGGNSDNWNKAHDFFMSQGWSDEQAAGLADTAQDESGVNPQSPVNTEGGGRGAHGLFQWRGPRLEQYKAMFGHDPEQGTLEENLQFAQWELMHTESGAAAALRGATSEEEARRVLRERYTRPGTPLPDRTPRTLTEQFKTKPPGLGPSVGTQPLPPPIPPAARTLTEQFRLLHPGQGPAAAPANTNNNSSNVTVGTINVQTQATDATGIARDLQAAMADITITSANRGLQ